MTVAVMVKTVPALTAIVMLVGCSRSEPSLPMRQDQLPAPCTRVVDGQVRYATAAGFGLATPDWIMRLPQAETFTPDCRLKTLTLQFALTDAALVPLPQPGGGHSAPGPDDTRALLTLRMRFDRPATDAPPVDAPVCAGAGSTHAVAQYGFMLCPALEDKSNPHVPHLPYYPRFELSVADGPSASMTCRHEDLRESTLANIAELRVPYACRGYWQWRPGAHVMFDLGPGEVLKQFRGAIVSAQATLDTWASPD